MLGLFSAAILSCAAGAAALTPIDAPHVPLATLASNVESPWQWWYFDAVSPSGAGLQIVYYSGYGFGPLIPVPYYIQISGNLPNGEIFNFFGADLDGFGTVEPSVGGYSNGSWGALGGWNSTEAGYVLSFNDGTGAVEGNLTLSALAPAHYPCEETIDPNFDTTTNLVGPELGWANAIPGAKAVGYFTLAGETYSLVGNGYHDSNFGLKELPELVDQWYWGRGIVGPYTFVYFAYLPKGTALNQTDPNDWYRVGYLAQDGATLAEFCSAERDATAGTELAIETRGDIWSAGPLLTGSPDGTTQGIALTYTVGGQVYKFNMTSMAVGLAGSVAVPYSRFTANITGGLDGETYTGQGYFELLDYGDA